MKNCFRFYGDETVAYYTAHEKKDMKGIDEDGVLIHNTDGQGHKISHEDIRKSFQNPHRNK